MSNPAIPKIHPAAVCPDWCNGSYHAHDQVVPNKHGQWNVMHTGNVQPVVVAEPLPQDAAATLTLETYRHASETEPDTPRLLWLRSVDHYGEQNDVNLTARQALRLAEVLVQQASAVLAEETAATVGAKR